MEQVIFYAGILINNLKCISLRIHGLKIYNSLRKLFIFVKRCVM